jgi:hypothetical protein
VDQLAATIEHGLSVLEQHADFMDHFRRPDASAELFIGYFGRVGSTLDWSLLARLGRLRIDLAMDVYEASD